MGILRRISIFGFSICLSGCFTYPGACENFSADILIDDWREGVPKAATLIRYKKNSSFSDILEISKKFSAEVMNDRGAKLLHIGFLDQNKMLVDSDYILRLEGLEFKISDIVSSNYPAANCPLKSAKINRCTNKSAGLIFDRSCGIKY